MSFNRKIIIGFISFVPTVYFLFFLYYCKAEPPIASACDLSHIQTGDLILSAGESFKSRIVKSFEESTSNTPDYSHIGVFINTGDSVYITHMSIDEGYIKREGLTDFIENNKVTGYDIYRNENPIRHTEKLRSIIDSIADTRKPFDRRFDIDDEDAYYCTELVYKSFLQAGINEMQKIKYDKYLYPNDIVNSGLFIKQNKE